MTSCLPWFKFRSAAPEEYPVHALCALLGPEADAYLFRLWAYCGRERLEGRFPGPGAALAVERAVRWRGRRGKLVEGLLAVGLLVLDGEDLVVATWADEQGTHIAKVERDRAKPDGRTAGAPAEPATAPRESLQSPAREDGGEKGEQRREKKSPARRAEETTSRERVPVAPQPPPLKSPSSAPRGTTAGDALEETLPDGVNRLNLEVKGVPYDWRPGRDDAAARELLSRGPVAEVLRRLENGLRAQFKQRVDTLPDLVRRWEANATPEERAGSAPAKTRAPDLAVGGGWNPVGGPCPTGCGREAWATVWGQPLCRLCGEAAMDEVFPLSDATVAAWVESRRGQAQGVAP
ncbi:hypothetical protein [Myxococcus sp. CA040A]|uniref:hypothetical protein n=1 Tax=Myxococcus sp. CA040A TaxID=2741738 RepID=UPI0020C5BC56|nr:hypothetical protein [Myxococcus sp. CA040A]